MWTSADRGWSVNDPVFEADELDPERAVGPWAGHRWFGYDLLATRSPETVVELGTHYGVSMFAFAQAVKDLGLRTRLHAVDTWQGDPHAGLYGPEVLAAFEVVRTRCYADVPLQLHQTLFDDALGDFEDASVDLMHIDGFHSYEAAKHDYESWLPKLAPDGVILLHDVAADTGYGSARFWQELAPRHPSFAFAHSFGLGVVLPKGTDGWEALLSGELTKWRPYYTVRWQAHLGGIQVRDQAQMIQDRDIAVEAQRELIDARDLAIASQTKMIDERDELLESEAARVVTLDAQARAAREELAAQEVRGASRTRSARARRYAQELGNRASRFSGRVPVLRRLAVSTDAEVTELFDAGYYLAHNPDVAKAGVDPLWHFLHHGGIEGRDPSPFFQSARYLVMHPDVAAAGVNPLVHFVRYGWREGRSPSDLFDMAFYTSTYPDAARVRTNPLLHYVRVGLGEGRFVNTEHRRRVMSHSLSSAREVQVQERRTVRSVVVAAPGETPQELPLGMLVGVDVDLVTVDLWDTLVARSRPADSAKLATARRQYLRHATELSLSSPWELFQTRVAVEADIAGRSEHEEYLLADVLTETIGRVLPDLAPEQARALALADATTEWRDEVASTYPLREVWGLLEALSQRPDGPVIAVVSDFYVPSARLRELLEHHGWAHAGTEVFVSCEQDASKRVGGGLYAKVRESFAVTADRHLHIGDNRHADYEMQLSTGGRAALVRLSPTPLPVPGALTTDSVEDCYDVLGSRLRAAAGFQVEFLEGDDLTRRARAAGILSAPLAVALVARACEAAMERGLDRVHYLSREGLFLSTVHEAVAATLGDGLDAWPRAVHLEVSRRATFGASLPAASPAALARMWSMYGVQSPRALLVSIGADPELFEPSLSRHGLQLDAPVGDIAKDARVAAFLADGEVSARLGAVLAEDRARLLAYLDSRTDVSADAWVVVDVGWRGTIQDNLAHVLTGRLHGVYLGLFPFLNPQPRGVTKEAVGFDGNLGEEFAFAEPPAAVERPWTPHLPSTIGYRRAGDGTMVVEHAQETHASHLINEFQRGVLTGAGVVAEFLVRFGFTASMVRPAVQRDMRAYYEQPAGGVADIWFGSDHDDTFGALNVTPFGKDRPDLGWLTARGDQAFAVAAMGSRWEPGFGEWLPVLSLRELRRMIEEVR